MHSMWTETDPFKRNWNQWDWFTLKLIQYLEKQRMIELGRITEQEYKQQWVERYDERIVEVEEVSDFDDIFVGVDRLKDIGG